MTFLRRTASITERVSSTLLQTGLCFVAIFCASSEASARGWLIYQEDRVAGPRTIFISAKGIRIETKADQSIIVSKPPKWNVVTYSDRNKCYYECAAGKFENILSRPIATFFGLNIAALPLKAVGPVTKCGVLAVDYQSTGDYGSQFWKRDVASADARRLPLTASAIFTDSLHVPEQEGALLVRLYNIPKLAGIPLVFSYRDQDKTFHWHIRTFSIKAIDDADMSFEKPSSYKKATTPTDVVRGAENDDVLKNLF